MNSVGTIGIIISIAALIIIVGVGFFSLNSTIKEELGILRQEMRVESAVNGYATLLAVSKIVNEGENYTFDEYLKEINEMRKRKARIIRLYSENY